MVCVYVDDKNFRKSLSYFRLKGRWYDYGLGKVIILGVVDYPKIMLTFRRELIHVLT